MRDSQNATATDAPGQLAYARVNPIEYGEEIKELFRAHERPEFPAFFDRTYADAVADGATSWIGRDAQGRLCAHVAQFPRPFRLGNREVRGALLANLMVAKAHRTLWPALKLMRRLVHDSKTSGSVDFLYGDPNEAAHAIVRAVGFRTVGALRRSVLPLTDHRPAIDLSLWLYHRIARFRVATTALFATAHRATDMPDGPTIAPIAGDDVLALRPVARPSVYRHRLAGYPSSRDWWYTFGYGPSERPVGAALVRSGGPDSQGLAVVYVLYCEPLAWTSSVLLSLADQLRETGTPKLEISVMDQSQLAGEVARAGFILRDERIPVVAMPLTPLGMEAMAVGAEWRLLPVDLDR